MAIDPDRIRMRAMEAEQSGRRPLNVDEAATALRVLAVVIDGESRDEQVGEGVTLERAS
ncbi:hypothetical protein [Streptomyces sp. NPDC001340]